MAQPECLKLHEDTQSVFVFPLGNQSTFLEDFSFNRLISSVLLSYGTLPNEDNSKE